MHLRTAAVRLDTFTEARALRDAMIYHECCARTFTRAAIAARYKVSVHRVHQIYAEQRKNPPAYPTAEQLAANPGLIVSQPALPDHPEPTTQLQPDKPNHQPSGSGPQASGPQASGHLILDAPPAPTPQPQPLPATITAPATTPTSAPSITDNPFGLDDSDF
jgi:hypothetical protein